MTKKNYKKYLKNMSQKYVLSDFDYDIQFKYLHCNRKLPI